MTSSQKWRTLGKLFKMGWFRSAKQKNIALRRCKAKAKEQKMMNMFRDNAVGAGGRNATLSPESGRSHGVREDGAGWAHAHRPPWRWLAGFHIRVLQYSPSTQA